MTWQHFGLLMGASCYQLNTKQRRAAMSAFFIHCMTLLNGRIFCPCVFYTAKIATAAHRTDLTKKTKRLRHKHSPDTRSHLLFRFLLVFLSAFAGEMLIKIHIMQKQLRIITSRHLAVCPVSSHLFPVPPVPQVVFSRHFRRRPVYYRPLVGCSVYQLASGWFLWCFPSGRRQLCALPF